MRVHVAVMCTSELLRVFYDKRKVPACYRTTTGEVGIVGDMVELDGSDSQATADYRPCQRRRLALGSV